MKSILGKYMPMRSGTSKSQNLQDERKKDHYSHFILRLAFSATEDLRRRFSRLETMLFRLRFKEDDFIERQAFVRSLNLEWEEVQEAEKRELKGFLIAASDGIKTRDEQEWFKVDWERVPELVEQRKVFLRRGKAYVPQREQMSLVVAEFTKKLDDALEVCITLIQPYRHMLTLCTAHVSRPPSSRRRRSPCPHPRAPFTILHSPRRRVLHLGRPHRWSLRYKRQLNRHSLPKLPTLHAQPAYDTA